MGSAWMPCERPIIGVLACSLARLSSAGISFSRRSTRGRRIRGEYAGGSSFEVASTRSTRRARKVNTNRMRTLIGYFLRGCLAILPIAATVYVAFVVVATIDHWVPVGIPGVGFVLTVVLITLAGFLTSNVVGRAALDMTDRLLARVPLAKLGYTSIRDRLGAFVCQKKRFAPRLAAPT